MWKEFLKQFDKRRKKEQRKLAVKAVLVSTGVVFYWRGVWNLVDHIVFPDQPILSALVTLVVGLLILFGSHKLIDELM